MELRITDGTTTLQGGVDFTLRRYTPQVPQLETEEAARAGVDGAEIHGAVYRNVSEQAEIYLDTDTEYAGGVVASAQAVIATIGRLFQQARHRQRTGLGARVWLEHQVEDGGDWYRSEILAGRCVLDDAKLRYGLQLAGEHVELALLWTRRFFWEYAGASPVEVPLEGATGGVAITNDAGNVVQIDDGDVVGDLPAPLRLELTDTYATNRHYTAYLALNVFSTPATYSHHVAGATTAAVGATETLLHTINLSAATLAALGGNVCRIMALMTSNWPNTLWLRWKVYWSVTKLWEGGWQQQTGINLRDMGAVPLPPRIVEAAGVSPEGMELRLYGRDATNPGITYTFTWFQLLPLDGWRVLKPAGYGLAQNTRLVDDGIVGEVWSDGWGGGGYTPHYVGHGRPLEVWPGRDQAMYVLVSSDTGTTIDGRTSTLRAYYRPRRLLL